MKEAARFDYNFIIEKMRRKHSKYRDLKKPTLRSLKRCASLSEVKLANLLRNSDYKRIQEMLPTRLQAEFLKLDTLTVKAIRQLSVARQSDEVDHEAVRQAVQFNEEWLSANVGLTPDLIVEYLAGFQPINNERRDELHERGIEDEVFSLLLPERFEELHDIGLGTPRKQHDQF